MSLEPASDTLINVIHQQIKRGIRVCLKENCYGSALILIYSGIDAMAFPFDARGSRPRPAKRFRGLVREVHPFLQIRSSHRRRALLGSVWNHPHLRDRFRPDQIR